MLSSTNRDNWEFEYTASVLAENAAKQRNYRVSRVEAWKKKKAEIMEDIKNSGLTVTESLSEKMSSYSSNRGARVVVDEKLQEDLDEAVEKIRAHEELAKKYDGWVQVLSANPHSRLKLKHDDWMFFFGK